MYIYIYIYIYICGAILNGSTIDIWSTWSRHLVWVVHHTSLNWQRGHSLPQNWDKRSCF